MNLCRVTGQVVATRKDDKLKGVRLLLVQPLNDKFEDTGNEQVATDGLSSREGELVIVVRAREASFALGPRPIPSDYSIVGRVDEVSSA